MSRQSVGFDTILIERALDVPPERAYSAWADAAAWDDPYDQYEFKVGGRNPRSFVGGGGHKYHEDGRYEDLVPGKRIVYSYTIARGDVRTTASLQTFEFVPDGGRSKMIMTEQIAILDEGDTVEDRERGIGRWMDNFEAWVKRG